MLQNIATIGYLPLDPLDPLDRSIFSPPQVTNLSAYPLVPPLPSYGLNRDWAKDLRQRCAKFHPDCACGGANAANILQHVKQFGRTPNAQLVEHGEANLCWAKKTRFTLVPQTKKVTSSCCMARSSLGGQVWCSSPCSSTLPTHVSSAQEFLLIGRWNSRDGLRWYYPFYHWVQTHVRLPSSPAEKSWKTR